MKIDKSFMSGITKVLVLSLIDAGDKYGYEIIRELDSKSYGTFLIKEGTLYPILHGLENNELVKSYIYKMETGRDRKYYKITRKGRIFLFEKKKEWVEFYSKVNLIIGI